MSRIKDGWIQIRVTDQEKKEIEILAKSENLPVGTFIRKTILDLCKASKKNR